MRVNSHGYIERRDTGGNTYRDWWLVKHRGGLTNVGMITMSTVYIPAKYVGKRVRLKIEVLEEKQNE